MIDLPVGEPVAPGDPALRPRREPLEGSHVRLEPLDRSAHGTGLFACSHPDPGAAALWTYMPYGPFADEAAMGDWLASIAPSADPIFFAVVDRSTDAAAGMVSFLNIDAPMRHVELGHIWYGPVAQRTRVNTESIFLMLRHAFDDLGYRRVEWKCDALNARSRAAALRLGSSFEGIFRRHMIVKGRNRDTAWFAMIDDDWPRVRENMQRWLGAEPGQVSLAALNASG